MLVTVNIPDEAATDLKQGHRDLPRELLEAYAAEGYRSGRLTHAQVMRLLGFAHRTEVDLFLKQHHAFLDYTEADLERDRLAHLALSGE